MKINRQEKIYNFAKDFHLPLWVIKDGAWFFGISWLSLTAAIPTILLSVYLSFYFKGKERLEWIFLSSWILSNTFWMISERINPDLHPLASISWSISFLMIPFYLKYLKNNP